MGDLVDFTPASPDDAAPVRRRARPQGRYCRHFRVELDEQARRVYCRDCKAEVDTFDYLVALAASWERYASSRDMAKRESERATAELAEVKRQVRNAKAQLRRVR